MADASKLRTYSVREVKEATGISRDALYRAIRGGRLVAVRPNGCEGGLRTREADLVRWLDECSVTPRP